MLISKSQLKQLQENSLLLPRLDQSSDSVDDVIVRHYNESTSIVNFSSIMDIANRDAISYYEAMKNIAEAHDVKDCIAVVHQAMLYENSEYRDAVLETMNDIKMQYVDAGTDEIFDTVLEQCIDEDIKNGNTDRIDSLLDEGVLSALTNWNTKINALGDNIKSAINNKIDSATSAVGNKIAGAAMQGANNYLDNEENREKLAKNLTDAGGRVASKLVDKATGIASDKSKPYVRGMKVGAGITLALGGMAAMFNSLTNQENINNAQPGMATRMINSLNKMYNIVTGKAQQAPPEQQGLFRTILSKIKWAIQALGRKVGLIK